MNNIVLKNIEFLKSSFTLNSKVSSLEDILNWIKLQKERVYVNIQKIPLSALKNWSIDESDGRLKHYTGKFFSIDGIRITTNYGYINQWEQPIINQNEIGYLGFIVKEFDGILHFLVQAKIEPGNINFVQLSPTLQATKSNYTRAHEGKAPLYLEYFREAQSHQILLDQLQSEQGARFLKKRNRNIIIKINEDIPVYDNFRWATLGQIKELIKFDNLVNMDTRTVISGISFGEYSIEFDDLAETLDMMHNKSNIGFNMLKSTLENRKSLNSFDDVLSFMTKQKSFYELDVERIPLKAVKGWTIREFEIGHEENKFFKVIAADIKIENREVQNWTQPMIESLQDGICAFVCKEIDGIIHFVVQAKLECGNFDIVELAPTVQCLTGNYKTNESKNLPFLDYVLTVPKSKILYDAFQSEEGGRFYMEQNRNLIVMAGDEMPLELPDNYIWMTLYQLKSFIKFNNYLNIQARSLLSAISFAD